MNLRVGRARRRTGQVQRWSRALLLGGVALALAVSIAAPASATPARGIAAILAPSAFALMPPEVENVSPNRGPLAGGTEVTITGANFTGATAVAFGSASA